MSPTESAKEKAGMRAPNVVVFDLGKVLLDFDYRIAAQGLAAQSRVSPRQIQEFIDHSPLLVEYETGRATRQEFFEAIRERSGYQGTLADFSALFSDVFTPIEPMIEFKRRLTAAGMPTFIFSNTNDLAIEHIRATYPFFNEFDGYLLSYEHGCMKPEAEFYQALEERTGYRGAQILYFDDREENVRGGAVRDWVAVHHLTPEASLRAALEAGLAF